MNYNIVVVGSSLDDKGGIVTVIKNINKHIDDEFFIKKVDTYTTTKSSFKKLLNFFKGFIHLVYLIIFTKVDIVHIHMSYKGSFYRKSLIIFLCKLFNKKIITHIHGSTFKDFYNASNKSLKKYIKLILNLSDRVIVLSKEWEKFFSSILEKEEKIFLLYNGVEAKKPIYNKEKKKIVNCVFLGRLGERKGIYDLLKAINLLKNNNLDVFFYLAGDGEIDKVREIIKDNNLEKYVECIGWVDEKQREELLKSSDVMILPSYNEGLPMAILEAMSYGLTIISTPVGGIPEAVQNQKNGYLVKPGNYEQLAQCIQEVIVNDEWRLRVKEINSKKIENEFNVLTLIKKLEDLYKELKCEGLKNSGE